MKKLATLIAVVAVAAGLSGFAAPSADAWSCWVWQGAPWVGGGSNNYLYETYGTLGGCSAFVVDLNYLDYYRNGYKVATTKSLGLIFYPFVYTYATPCNFSGPVNIRVNTFWTGYGDNGSASGQIFGKTYYGWCGLSQAPQVARVYPTPPVTAPAPKQVCCDDTCCPSGTQQKVLLSK